MSKFASCLLAGVCLSAVAARAQQADNLPPVEVSADRASRPVVRSSPDASILVRGGPNASIVTRQDIATQAPRSNDAARLLENTPGVSLYGAGAVSSLPVIHGLEDQRNNVVLGGVPITAACANHMNPPLSYMDPAAIGQVEVLTANVPVSKGGDSIGGAILVTPRPPIFAAGAAPAPGLAVAPGVVASGSLSSYFRSNGGGIGVSGHIDMATEHFSLQYDGAWGKSGNYYAGGGDRQVRSTLYQATNHAATLAYANDGQTLAFRYAYQWIPYQGFPNQWMDLMGNNANTYDLSYKGAFGWGALEANAYYHLTQHYMNFLADKWGGYAALSTTGMPMHVNDQDYGYNIKATINLGETDVLRVGNELHMQTLNEWWPPVAGKAPMMCCATFVNINDGQRNVLGTYIEWEKRWGQGWSLLVGLRNDTVWTDAGDVQGYSKMYASQAQAFNAQDHAKAFVDFDATAVLRYNPDDTSQFEFGYTRKTRAPSIYELYTWSTNGMAARMIGWYGDGNGYYGNLNLDPEVAHTVAITGQWSDPTQQAWQVKLGPYYSYVQDYIDVDERGQIAVANAFGQKGYVNLLQFANHDAELYGFDLAGRAMLAQTPQYGDFSIVGVVGYVRGWRVDNGESLYHMTPLNGRVTLQNTIALWGGRLTSALEIQASAAKTQVESVRLEPTTPAYGVINLRTSWEYRNVRFDLGVENIANVLYYNPLGGIDISDWKVGASSNLHTPVASAGRNVYGGVTVQF